MCMQDLATEALSVLYLPTLHFEREKEREKKGKKERKNCEKEGGSFLALTAGS